VTTQTLWLILGAEISALFIIIGLYLFFEALDKKAKTILKNQHPELKNSFRDSTPKNSSTISPKHKIKRYLSFKR
jgi:hypothetical protein